MGTVERGNTVSDFDPLEKQYLHSSRQVAEYLVHSMRDLKQEVFLITTAATFMVYSWPEWSISIRSTPVDLCGQDV